MLTKLSMGAFLTVLAKAPETSEKLEALATVLDKLKGLDPKARHVMS